MVNYMQGVALLVQVGNGGRSGKKRAKRHDWTIKRRIKAQFWKLWASITKLI